MTIGYDWDCENCYVDRDGVEQDVIDHFHESRVKRLIGTHFNIPHPSEYPVYEPASESWNGELFDWPNEIDQLVLVKDYVDENGDLYHRAWAYAENVLGWMILPEDFDDGARVPKRFHQELAKAQANAMKEVA